MLIYSLNHSVSGKFIQYCEFKNNNSTVTIKDTTQTLFRFVIKTIGCLFTDILSINFTVYIYLCTNEYT